VTAMNITCYDRNRIFEGGSPAEWTALETHAASCTSAPKNSAHGKPSAPLHKKCATTPKLPRSGPASNKSLPSRQPSNLSSANVGLGSATSISRTSLGKPR